MSIVVNPVTPYFGEIPGTLHVGSAVTVNGKVKLHSQRFNIDFLCCAEQECRDQTDLALHLSIRFDEKAIVRNSYHNRWMEEERYLPSKDFPIAPGQPFGIMILNDKINYKIAINGQHVAEFRHRIPFFNVKGIAVKGDILISKISYESLPVPQPNHQGCPVPYVPPVYHPAVPFTQFFHGGFQMSEIRFSAIPHPFGKGFSINFRSDISDVTASQEALDIPMHYDVRFFTDNVIMNCKQNGTWRNEERGVMAFHRGHEFELVITINNHSFQFVSNGKLAGQFQHRMLPISRITSMQIDGNLIITNIRFI